MVAACAHAVQHIKRYFHFFQGQPAELAETGAWRLFSDN